MNIIDASNSTATLTGEGGKTVTATVAVYQEANTKTVTGSTGGEISYGAVTAGSISSGTTIAASGGSCTLTVGNGSQSWYKAPIITSYKWTSGDTSSDVTEVSSNGSISVSPSQSSVSYTAESLNTTVTCEWDDMGPIGRPRFLVYSKTITWTGNNNISATKDAEIYQSHNYPRYFFANTLYMSYNLESSNIPTDYMNQLDWMAAGGGTFTPHIMCEAYFESGSRGEMEITNGKYIYLQDVGYGIYGSVNQNEGKVYIDGRGANEGDDRYMRICCDVGSGLIWGDEMGPTGQGTRSCSRMTGQQYNHWWDGRLQAFWWSDWTTYRSVGHDGGEHSIIIICYRHYTSGAESAGIDVTPSSACSIYTSDASTSISKWEGYYYFHYGRYNSSASRTIYITASYNGLTSPAITLYQTGINDISYGGLEITDLYWNNSNYKVNKGYHISTGFTCRRWVSQSFGGGWYEYSQPSVSFSGTATPYITEGPYIDAAYANGYFTFLWGCYFTSTGTYSLTVNFTCWGQTHSATKYINVT